MAFEAPVHPRPAISFIVEGLPPDGGKLYIGDIEGARDLAALKRLGITTVVNCAVNLDINYVKEPAHAETDTLCAAGFGEIRYYKLGLVDGPGNPETLMLAGYFLLDGAIRQQLPERATYPRRERGNVLVHCRGGRSRSVALVALYLHLKMPERFATMEAAIAHIRHHRELYPDEWFETPKPMLLDAAVRAAGWVRRIEADSSPPVA
ncbi:MAG: dual specificity protein phosphatase family protein [Rhodospirillales bacterium]|nr:dual specificity protein phosphatase family protein [Rhodospirillales bacterium]